MYLINDESLKIQRRSSYQSTNGGTVVVLPLTLPFPSFPLPLSLSPVDRVDIVLITHDPPLLDEKTPRRKRKPEPRSIVPSNGCSPTMPWSSPME